MAFNRPATRDLTISALAVTDTGAKTGSAVDVSDAADYQLSVVNTLNQAGNAQIQGSVDGGSTWFNVGAAVALAATTSGIFAIPTPKPFFGLVRAVYTASLAPGSGTLSIGIDKRF